MPRADTGLTQSQIYIYETKLYYVIFYNYEIILHFLKYQDLLKTWK